MDNQISNLLHDGTFTCDSKILILEPHPDDACISCTGLIKHCPSIVHIITITKGECCYGEAHQAVADLRSKETQRFMKSKHIEDHVQFAYPDGEVCAKDMNSMLVQDDEYSLLDKIKSYIEINGITHVFAPSRHDMHDDHAYIGKVAYDLLEVLPDIQVFECDSTSPLTSFSHYIALPYAEIVSEWLHNYYPSQCEFGPVFTESFTHLAHYRSLVIRTVDSSVRYGQVFNKLSKN